VNVVALLFWHFLQTPGVLSPVSPLAVGGNVGVAKIVMSWDNSFSQGFRPLPLLLSLLFFGSVGGDKVLGFLWFLPVGWQYPWGATSWVFDHFFFFISERGVVEGFPLWGFFFLGFSPPQKLCPGWWPGTTNKNQPTQKKQPQPPPNNPPKTQTLEQETPKPAGFFFFLGGGVGGGGFGPPSFFFLTFVFYVYPP